MQSFQVLILGGKNYTKLSNNNGNTVKLHTAQARKPCKHTLQPTHTHCYTNAALCAQGQENQFQPVSTQNLHTTNKADECQLADCGSVWVCWRSSYQRYGAVSTIYMCTCIVTQMRVETEWLFIDLFIIKMFPLSKVLKSQMFPLRWAGRLFQGWIPLRTYAAGIGASTLPVSDPIRDIAVKGKSKWITVIVTVITHKLSWTWAGGPRRNKRGLLQHFFYPYLGRTTRGGTWVLFFVPVLLFCSQLTVPWEGAIFFF